ncbi:hypothetical protein L1987_04616 [Smallanthus sonchifolius]|uniref:Uncharacterized protein n=1 Tax=Smallanthus sonchifolius TaxID=185202 RepID=A0ACB9JT28_9ASTR|nr:hypothetical protein L1987_04616 [Smallanthus sonchifolius]
MRRVGGTCDFGGTAITTTVDPSYGSCIFTGSTNSSIGGTVTPAAFGPEGPPGNVSPGQLPDITVLLLATVVLLIV